MITIENASKSFGEKVVLKDVNLTIKDGSIFGLVGINGAGKTTLMRMLSGVYDAGGGKILYDGVDVYDNEKVKKDIFYLPDDPYFSFYMTGKDLKEYYEQYYNFNEGDFLKYLNDFGLQVDKALRTFSKGMRRQMYVALAFACKPKYLILDEAFDGLDPLARLKFKRTLIELGSTVIISSHSLRELEDICDEFALLAENKVAICGDTQDELNKMSKFQVVFKDEIDEIDLPFKVVKFEKNGHVVHFVARDEKKVIIEKLAVLEPIVVDEEPLDFEEMFICEVQARGYNNVKND